MHILDCLVDPYTRTHLKEISEKFYENKAKKKPTDSEITKYSYFQHMLADMFQWYTGLTKEQQVCLTVLSLRFRVMDVFGCAHNREETGYYET